MNMTHNFAKEIARFTYKLDVFCMNHEDITRKEAYEYAAYILCILAERMEEGEQSE